MRAIKQYRVKLMENNEVWKLCSTIFDVNSYIQTDVMTRNLLTNYDSVILFANTGNLFVKPTDYMIESYDWDALEFRPSHFGIIKNA